MAITVSSLSRSIIYKCTVTAPAAVNGPPIDYFVVVGGGSEGGSLSNNGYFLEALPLNDLSGSFEYKRLDLASTCIVPHASAFTRGVLRTSGPSLVYCGGQNSYTVSPGSSIDCIQYDPSTKTWTNIANLAHDQSDSESIQLNEDDFWVLGT